LFFLTSQNFQKWLPDVLPEDALQEKLLADAQPKELLGEERRAVEYPENVLSAAVEKPGECPSEERNGKCSEELVPKPSEDWQRMI